MVQVNTVCGEVHSSAGFLRASVQSAGTEGRGAHVRTADFFFFPTCHFPALAVQVVPQ